MDQRAFRSGESASDPVRGSGDIRIECIWRGPAELGECPIWDERRQRLFWIDSLQCRIWCCDASGRDLHHWQLPEVIGSIGLREDGGFIAGLASGFALLDLASGDEARSERIGDPEPDLADTRLNDGKVDRQGRFWCGSMNRDFAEPNASLYRLEETLSWQKVDSGITVSNGLAFSLDGATLYFSDSRVDRSYRYDLDQQSGALSNRRAFIDTGSYRGRIDGATVDARGNYWGALFEGGAIGCFSPQGDLLHHIGLPVSCPTMCAFGGERMNVLYVTSATFSLDHEKLAQEQQAGGLFAIHGLDAQGIPEPRFKGVPRGRRN